MTATPKDSPKEDTPRPKGPKSGPTHTRKVFDTRRVFDTR